MTPTDAQVEGLAMWLQDQFRVARPEVPLWWDTTDRARSAYRHAARELLERPPAVLRDAAGLPAPDAVREGGS